jgi:predicted TIM-barrel fold metal-dependent hydrolase
MTPSIIDVHAHYQPRSLNDFMARFSQATTIPQAPWTDVSEHIEARLQMMDQAGVRLQILSPGTTHYFAEPARGVEAAHLINDLFAEFAARHPNRFATFTSLPLPHVDASLRELERMSPVSSTLGVTLHCFILDRSVTDPAFDPIYEELNRRQAVLFLHPCRNGLCSAFINDYGLAESVGTSVEDTLAVLHMIIRQIPTRYPGIRIVVPHLGGLLPMLLQRLDSQMTRVHADLAERPSLTACRFWYDTVSHGSGPALRCACEAFGADRLVPGSDFPFMLFRHPYQRAFTYVEESGLSATDAGQILYSNVSRLLAPEG